MSKQPRFWRNVALIGLAHVAFIAGLIRWNAGSKNTNSQSVVWINSSSSGGGGPAPVKNYRSVATPPKESIQSPESSPPNPVENDEDRPVLTSAKSEIQLPTASPSPTPTAKPSASPAVKVPPPKPTPKPRKPTPKPSPKPTPKPSPKKTLLAKASPKPSPKLKPTPEPAEEKDDDQTDAEEEEKKRIAKAALARITPSETEGDSSDKPVRKAIAAHNADGDGTSGDTNEHGGGTGAGAASEFGWYGAMLHDRFYSEWTQPTTSISSSSKISTLVKVRIEKDGRVSSFEIIKPSGNVLIDESVGAIAKHVRQVDPLPAGLGKGGHYDVKINFELNSEQ